MREIDEWKIVYYILVLTILGAVVALYLDIKEVL
jgi:hypothetical protein